jgi:50S ribosomal protein L16 3-hydroxylase
MISYAENGGSVGPHLDEYDVFLIQAKGRRRWLIEPEPAFDAAMVPDLDLRILKSFQASETYLVEPGDVLYLPPGIPHWGIAEGPCMTWSVGFRAPAWGELAASWCEHVAEHRLPTRRYADPGLRAQTHSGEILPEVFARVRQTLYQGLTDSDGQAFQEWFGRFVTEPKEHLQVLPNRTTSSTPDLLGALDAGRALQRNTCTRMAFCRGVDDGDLLFVNGEAYRLKAQDNGLLPVLTNAPLLHKANLSHWLDDPACVTLLRRLLAEGHYELVDFNQPTAAHS